MLWARSAPPEWVTRLLSQSLGKAPKARTMTAILNAYAEQPCKITGAASVLCIADAHVRALDYLLSGGSSCALNLANAKGYSVMDVIKAPQQVVGKIVGVEMAPRRPEDSPVLIGAADRARAVLGWAPTRSVLDVQIADAWNWMQKEPALRAMV